MEQGHFDLTEKRKVLLGVTGSIAAYKAVELARLLISWGHEVRVVMSESAQEFIAPLTFEAVTGQSVVTGFWEGDGSEIEHIALADWADVVVIAPATADTIAKLAYGFADSPLTAICLATRAPLLVAPAMNVNMLEHPQTQANIQVLKGRRVQFVDPEEGALACGWQGSGRLADPMEIFYHTRRALSRNDLAGKQVLIVTGPTREPIDPVRYISNRSSGKMGVTLAREAFRRGAEVTMIHGPIRHNTPAAVRRIEVRTALDMRDAVMARAFPSDGSAAPDVVIMAAAVADFRPAEVSKLKVKKSKMPKSVQLAQNPDILLELGEARQDAVSPLLVGFAVETGELEELLSEARSKLERKKIDMIIGNFAEEALELDTNRVWILDRSGKQEEIATTYKSRISNKILDRILKL